MVSPVDVLLDESEIMRLILEYLSSRGLLVSMLTLERETGIANGKYSDEGHFVRQLILDGQWNDVLSFIQPLSSIPEFDMKPLLYLVHKQRYLEMLNAKSELHPDNHQALVDEMVRCAANLEKLCPSKTDYDNLCVLLTLSNLADHVGYKNWNLLSARLECFERVYSVISEFLPYDVSSLSTSSEVTTHRLIHLLVKGLLYESCSEFCLSRASADREAEEFSISSLITSLSLSDSDLCLMSWLSVLPPEVFTYSFERRSLKLCVKPLDQTGKQLQTDQTPTPISKLTAVASLNSSNIQPFTLCFDKRNSYDNDNQKSVAATKTTSRSMQLVGQLFESCKGLDKKESDNSPESAFILRTESADGLPKTTPRHLKFEDEQDLIGSQQLRSGVWEANPNIRNPADDRLTGNSAAERNVKENKGICVKLLVILSVIDNFVKFKPYLCLYPP